MGVAVVKANMIYDPTKAKRPARRVGFFDALVLCCYLGCYIKEG